MVITALYAGLLTPLFIVLALRVIRARQGARVAVGDGGNTSLLRRMRVHANFAEYVPLALLLMALAESLATSRWLLHAAGVTLIVGRITHAIGMSQAKENLALRVVGVVSTLTVLIVLALACVAGSLWRGAGF